MIMKAFGWNLSHGTETAQNRRVHALSCIMGNKVKILKKQSGKRYVFLPISALSFISEKELLL